MDGQPNTGSGAGSSESGSRLPDDVTQSARQGMEAGRETMQDMGRNVDRATEPVQRKAGELGREAADQARALGHRVEEVATSRMEQSRHQLAEGMHAIGEALRIGAQQVRQRDNAPGTQFLERLAEPVDRISDYLEHHDTREITTDLERFARQNEAMFLGGAFALGMLGARFLKASPTEIQRTRDEEMSLYQQTDRVREPERDAVGRPGAAGYETPSMRASMGDDPEASGPRGR